MDVEVAKQHKADFYVGNFRHVSNRISSIPPALQQRFADAGLGLQDQSKDKDDIESARSGIASVFDQYTAFFLVQWN